MFFDGKYRGSARRAAILTNPSRSDKMMYDVEKGQYAPAFPPEKVFQAERYPGK